MAPVPGAGTPTEVLTALREGVDLDAGTREHYEDAALYDYEYRRRRDDVGFYRTLARRRLGKRGRVLELGCGTGRITAALLRDGHEVVGLDVSEPMLARAEERIARLGRAAMARVELHRADMRTFALRERFDLVISAFNCFEHLYDRQDLRVCLERVRAHLGPGGALAFDVQMPDLDWLCRDPHKRWARTRFTHPGTGEKMYYSTNHDYDPVRQVVSIRLYYEPAGKRGPTRVVNLVQRKYFPVELEALLDAAGYDLLARFGSFDERPLESDSESQILVCSPRAL